MPLGPPDLLHSLLPENPLCLITDDGAALDPTLTAALLKQGWETAVLRYAVTSAFIKVMPASIFRSSLLLFCSTDWISSLISSRTFL